MKGDFNTGHSCPLIVRRKEVARMLAISLSTLHNWTNPKSKWFNKNFPKPIHYGGNSVGFMLSELTAWAASFQRTINMEAIVSE